MFSRHSGVSKAPFTSCNVAFTVADNPQDVRENRRRIKESMGGGILLSSRQVHGDKIYLAGNSLPEDQELLGYDAMVSNRPGTLLMIQQADCQAVVLFDPRERVVANIHSGWRGSVLNIIGKTIQLMRDEFAVDPQGILAGISPSLGPCCAEFTNFAAELPEGFHRFQQRPNYFDFWAISQDQLEAAGVKRGNVEIARVCTKCSYDYFSYRREAKTGRFATVIGLAGETQVTNAATS